MAPLELACFGCFHVKNTRSDISLTFMLHRPLFCSVQQEKDTAEDLCQSGFTANTHTPDTSSTGNLDSEKEISLSVHLTCIK